MTTLQAEKLYLAQHLQEHEGKKVAVYNPLNKAPEDLLVIYGFNNGGSPRWYNGVLLSMDGVCLGGHVCSHESYMLHDLGILEGTRPDRHENFKKYYPEGYKMEFVSSENLAGHVGLRRAISLHQEQK